MKSRQKANSSKAATKRVNSVRPLEPLPFFFFFFDDEREEDFPFVPVRDAEGEAFRVVFVGFFAMRQACSYCSVLVVWSQTSLGPKYWMGPG